MPKNNTKKISSTGTIPPAVPKAAALTANPDLISLFHAELEKSLILEDTEKAYWQTNADTLPKTLIEYFYNYLKEKNDIVDSYIKKAIQAHPEMVEEIKTKVTKIKNTIAELHRIEDKKGAEKFLEEQLKQI